MRHAYAQFHGLIVGQTWSTFSDPAAVVVREIRGEPDLPTVGSDSATAWGATLSGVVPFYILKLTDRFIAEIEKAVQVKEQELLTV